MFNLFKRNPIIDMCHGLIPSPPDDRDYLLSGIIPEIKRCPREYPRPFDLTIFNQGSNPSCVGWTGATIKQFMEMKERTFIIPDGEWLYKECKKIDGMPNLQGTFFRAVLQVLKNVGCKLQGEDNDPSLYRIQEYRKVDNVSFEELKKTIAVYGHFLGGWRGSNKGWAGEVIRPPKTGEKVWGHAAAGTHYWEDYLGGQNSWGESYHNKGLFKSKEDYLPFEAWVIVQDAVNEASPEVKTGWVAKTYLDAQNKTTANLNVRAGAGTGYPKITTLPQGTQVKLYGSANKPANGHWWTQIIL